jgi:hypothetical protein
MAKKTSSGQATPINSRLAPVMFANANAANSGSEPAVNAK